MKQLLLLSLFAVLCKMAPAQNKIDEGSIIYSIQWTLPPNAPPQMAGMLPTEMKVYFKGDSSVTLAKSAVSASSTILNPKTEYLRLLLDIPMANKKLSILFTPADQEELKDQLPDFELTEKADTKPIIGYQAKRYTVKDKKSGQTFDAWFTKDLDIIQNSLSQFFDKSHGFPLLFNTIQNGMQVKAEVKEIKSEKIPDGSFSKPKEYEEITYDELKKMMQAAEH